MAFLQTQRFAFVSKVCLLFIGEVDKVNGRNRFTEPHAPPEPSPQQDLQVKKQDLWNVIDRSLSLPLARLIANQPLRAKEASPLISKDYPIIVTMRYTPPNTGVILLIMS